MGILLGSDNLLKVGKFFIPAKEKQKSNKNIWSEVSKKFFGLSGILATQTYI